MRRYVFKYSPEPLGSGTINRPKATVFLCSKNGAWQPSRVYIDSGADLSLFRRVDADLLGLNLVQGDYRPIVGVGRILIPAYTHKIKIRIGDTELDVEAAFAVSNEVPRLLGRTECFSSFQNNFL